MIKQDAQRCFPVVEGDEIDEVEYAGIAKAAELGIREAASHGDVRAGVMLAKVLCYFECPEKIAGEGHTEADKVGGEALQMDIHAGAQTAADQGVRCIKFHQKGIEVCGSAP